MAVNRCRMRDPLVVEFIICVVCKELALDSCGTALSAKLAENDGCPL